MPAAVSKPTRSQALHLYPPKATLDKAAALIEKAQIPHVPEIVLALREELGRPEPDLQTAASLILRDPATGALLKVVNSSAFNRPTHVSSVAQAASLLGVARLTH